MVNAETLDRIRKTLKRTLRADVEWFTNKLLDAHEKRGCSPPVAGSPAAAVWYGGRGIRNEALAYLSVLPEAELRAELLVLDRLAGAHARA